MKKRDFTRRDFIKTTGAVTAGALLAPTAACATSPFDAKGLPTAILGKTGVRVPRIVFGLGSRFMSIPEDQGLELLEAALNKGFYYWDTAASYQGSGQFSEERIGKILSPVRERVFLSSKVGERKADDAKKTVETSLKRLQTDYIDLLQIHSIRDEDDVKQLGEPDGVLPVLQKYRDEGVIRHIGFTGHTSASAMKLAAEMYDFDTMLIALNHHQKGNQSFEEEPAPFAAKKGMGVIAMKAVRPRETVETLTIEELIRYALSLKDFTTVAVGMDSLDVLNKNLAILQNFKPYEADKMNSLRAALDPFYRSDKLPWMQPGYTDGVYWA